MKYLALGKRLRQLRQELSLTQKELGKRIGFSGARVAHYENDELPTREYLETFIQKLELEAYASELWALYEDAKKTARQHESNSTLPFPSNPFAPAWSIRAQGRNLPHHAYHPLEQCEELLNKLTAQLANPDDYYALALCGSGGVGKTTLALQAARRVLAAGHFVDALWLSARAEWFARNSADTSLKQIETFEELLDALALQMGLEDVLRQDPHSKRRTIADHLWTERIVIVFDNFEEWRAAKHLTRQLLPILGRSRLLITTRDGRLDDLDMIWIHVVKGLSKRDAAHFAQKEAARGGFEIHKPELDALRELHAQTGGIPYALKRVLSCLKHEGLEAAREFLQVAPAPERQEFYAYLFAREWQKLDTPARQLWVYLGRMIPSSISRAQLLQHAHDSAEWDAALCQLQAYLLVDGAEDTEHATVHYSLHPLARQFILQINTMLALDAGLALYQSEGCVFQAATAWRTQARADANILLSASNRDSIVACVHECSRIGAHAAIIALWDAISTPLYEFGYWKEYAEIERATLQATQELGQLALQSEVLTELAWLAISKGQLENAEELTRRALRIFSHLENRRGIVIAKRYLATILLERKDVVSARSAFQQLLREIQEYQSDADDKLQGDLFRQEITTRDSLGIVLTELGEYPEAARELEFAYKHALERGESAQAESLYNLGVLSRKRNENQQAHAYFQECLTLSQKLHLRDTTARVLTQLAQIAYSDGNTQKALTLAEQARRIFHTLGAASSELAVTIFLSTLRT